MSLVRSDGSETILPKDTVTMDLPVNPFKTLLASRRPAFGVWASFPSAATVEALAHSPYDWMLIDTEHAPVDLDTLHGQLQAAGNGLCLPVVRPAWSDRILIKRLLDIGVQNFMLPMIDSPEQAMDAVGYVRYPPRGVRGIAGATRASRYGRVERYLQQADAQIAVLAQIESPQAVGQAAAIAGVEGVDGLFIGPNDLAASLGYPGELRHPAVTHAIARVIDSVRPVGKTIGILAANVEDAAHYLGAGVTLIACGSDVRLLTRGADDMARRLQLLVQPALAAGVGDA